MGTGITNATAVGWGQQTPAIQATARLAAGVRSATGRRRRRKAKRASPTPRKRKRRASSSRKAKLVKGSAAAKRYMAKLRRMRKRK